MPFDFDRYAAELVQLLQLSKRPGWNPETAVKMYLQHAHAQGYGEALAVALQHVDQACGVLGRS